MKLDAIIKQSCPNCRQGKMFKGLFRMYHQCEHCGFNFDREQGYWTGAMFVSSFLPMILVGPVWVALLLTGQSFWLAFSVTIALLIVLTPLIFRYSRVIWLHMDYSFDVKEAQPKDN
jgi:uncharacterized protein (DUF983 family)